MSRTFFAVFFVLLLTPLFGAGDGWDHYATFSLEKDQKQTIEIHEGKRIHRLTFRWTLYKNGGLVMHVNYDKHSYQPLLYARYRLDSYKIDLFPKADDASRQNFETPYALIAFKAFDGKKRRAALDLMIKDYGMSEIFYAEGK
ncbi:hypothetical protein [Hydrogenimonas sp.]